MGLLSKKEKTATPPVSAHKYDYAQFLSTGGEPNKAAMNTAAHYSQRAATSREIAALESSKRSHRPSMAHSRRRMCSPGRLWMHFLTFFQIAVAIGIIVVVSVGLNQTVEIPPASPGAPPASASVCLATTRSVNICTYSYWIAGASIAASLLISIMNLCCPGRRNSCCLSVESIIGLIAAAWWVASAVTVLIFSNEANDAGLQGQTYRTILWILCWANAALFGLSFLSSMTNCCAACCGMVDEDEV